MHLSTDLNSWFLLCSSNVKHSVFQNKFPKTWNICTTLYNGTPLPPLGKQTLVCASPFRRVLNCLFFCPNSEEYHPFFHKWKCVLVKKMFLESVFESPNKTNLGCKSAEHCQRAGSRNTKRHALCNLSSAVLCRSLPLTFKRAASTPLKRENSLCAGAELRTCHPN